MKYKKILALDTSKYTVKEIAAKCDCSLEYVRKLLNTKNLPYVKQAEYSLNNLKELPVEEMTLDEIVERLGLSKSAIKKQCSKLGRKYKPLSKSRNKLLDNPNAVKDAKRMSKKAFMKKYKCSEPSYKKYKAKKKPR